MDRRAWIVLVVALVCAVPGAAADTRVQGEGSSSASAGSSGTATGGNSSVFGGAPQAIGGSSAAAAHNGESDGGIHQRARSSSGAGVAGSQTAGAADRNATVQEQNRADAPEAASGDAESDGLVFVSQDPLAIGDVAHSASLGGSSVDVMQDTQAVTGDAVAGSQVTGIAGSGDHSVQVQDTSVDADALSGEALTDNLFLEFIPADFAAAQADDVLGTSDIETSVDQIAMSETGDALAGSQATGVAGGSLDAQLQVSSLDGSAETGAAEALNEASSDSLKQGASAATGDALAGSQLSGVVADGDVLVQAQDVSDGDLALTGDALAENNPKDVTAFGSIDDGEVGPLKLGDETMTVMQTAIASSGDALAGSQVTGIAAPSGAEVTVQLSGDAIAPEAISGDADAFNTLIDSLGPLDVSDLFAGAMQVGDVTILVDQEVSPESGDAVAGAQITGVARSG